MDLEILGGTEGLFYPEDQAPRQITTVGMEAHLEQSATEQAEAAAEVQLSEQEEMEVMVVDLDQAEAEAARH